MMRILFLNQFYIPDTAATGQLLADVAQRLASQGHDVHVVCSRRGYNGGRQLQSSRETIRGVRVHRVWTSGFGRARMRLRLLDWGTFYLMAAWRALWLPRMDVCVSLTTPPFIGLIGVMLSRLRRTRLLLWSMDTYPEVLVAFRVLREQDRVYRVLSWVSRQVYRHCSAVISLGKCMTERLQEAGVPIDKIHTIDNWVPGEVIPCGGSAKIIAVGSDASGQMDCRKTNTEALVSDDSDQTSVLT